MTDIRRLEYLAKCTPEKKDKILAIEGAIETIFEAIGENIQFESADFREGIKFTPFRVAKMYLDEICNGYDVDLGAILNEAKFKQDCDEIVLVKDIPFYSLCEHHILPFFGKAHVAYIPRKLTDEPNETGNIVGLSKLARVVEVASRKLQIQEGLTKEIADAIQQTLKPIGVAVIIEGDEHMCMTMRGVAKPGSSTTTSTMLGAFKEKPEARAELLQLINSGR